MNQKHRHHRGTTLVECIVAASVLSIALGTVATAVVRIGRIWTDSAHYRIALQEVSNHLESLTQLPADQVPASLASLTVSPEVNQLLVNSQLSGELVQDEFGERIKLELTWNDGRPVRPVRLTAWLAGAQLAEEQE